MEETQLPTAEGVLEKIKDDGDFDALRLKIIKKVKDNEELRNSIMSQIKESNVLNQEGSEDMKPRQLSDAIYQELGRKIMGQISDEIWRVIRSDGSIQGDIKGTVENVCKKMVNPESQEKIDASPSNIRENIIDAREVNNDGTCVPTPTSQVLLSDSHESDHQVDTSTADHNVNTSKNSELQELEEAVAQRPPDRTDPSNEALPPGFGSIRGVNHNVADDDPDMPPGFC
ncbi:hypothetical protein AXF42_Ash019845 [Apostasia shenzhenica]|uniref:BOD1/SHG1 domain-containing protein n=1 Tax=Apostasia shenzhenica TaxID=1088818 RepID=A0A2I0ARG2_9ASPA|nr:hypothetical protein AXF42_Ash019845 [Apostasia shenzhenica]